MERGSQWDHLKGFVEYIPVHELEGLEGNELREDIGPLRESVKAEGIKTPLQIMYNHKTGYTFVGEGSHRLAVARELGMSEVPAVVNRTTWEAGERQDYGDLPGKTREPYRGTDWFGAIEPPSKIGFTGRAP